MESQQNDFYFNVWKFIYFPKNNSFQFFLKIAHNVLHLTL